MTMLMMPGEVCLLDMDMDTCAPVMDVDDSYGPVESWVDEWDAISHSSWADTTDGAATERAYSPAPSFRSVAPSFKPLPLPAPGGGNPFFERPSSPTISIHSTRTNPIFETPSAARVGLAENPFYDKITGSPIPDNGTKVRTELMLVQRHYPTEFEQDDHNAFMHGFRSDVSHDIHIDRLPENTDRLEILELFQVAGIPPFTRLCYYRPRPWYCFLRFKTHDDACTTIDLLNGRQFFNTGCNIKAAHAKSTLYQMGLGPKPKGFIEWGTGGGPKPDDECFRCHKFGHWHKGCRTQYHDSPRNTRPQPNDYCYRCGGKGHWAKECNRTHDGCNRCGRKDHWARECNLPYPEHPLDECYACGVKGHWAKTCPRIHQNQHIGVQNANGNGNPDEILIDLDNGNNSYHGASKYEPVNPPAVSGRGVKNYSDIDRPYRAPYAPSVDLRYDEQSNYDGMSQNGDQFGQLVTYQQDDDMMDDAASEGTVKSYGRMQNDKGYAHNGNPFMETAHALPTIGPVTHAVMECSGSPGELIRAGKLDTQLYKTQRVLGGLFHAVKSRGGKATQMIEAAEVEANLKWYPAIQSYEF